MKTLTLAPIAEVSGTVRLPGSKSISNRVLLLAAVAESTCEIHNILRSDDTALMLQALRLLGVQWSRQGDTIRVVGKGGPLVTTAAKIELNLGLAGTVIRPLTAMLTLGKGVFTLDGEPRMRERPIADLVNALIELGGQVDYLARPGYPPIKVTGSGLAGGHCSLPGTISSQFLTSVLMAAPLARSPVTVTVPDEQASKPYLDITLDLMRRFGVPAQQENYRRFHVPHRHYHSPEHFVVEGDASSASYFLAAGAIAATSQRPLTVQGIGRGSIQGDFAFIEVLQQMGARVECSDTSVTVHSGELQGHTFDLNHIPDAAMTVAVLALFAKGPTRIENIGNWRVKETDRLDAMARELRKIGATVKEGTDYLEVEPPAQLRSARIATYGDHRMAMCFSLAALGGVPITIENPDCVTKTYPDYFASLQSICRQQ